MDDLINRRAAIEALDEYFGRIGKLKRRGLNKGERAISLDVVGVIRMEPSAWIPCSERLPEEKGEYLVTYHPCYWDNVEDEIRVGTDTFRGRTTWAKKKFQRVIAWMPLPEPYKEEE